MKKILFVYPSMLLGGSTTSLLALINNLDPDEFEIDLQLLNNSGPLFGDVPKHVHILPEAQKYAGYFGRIIKRIRFVLLGAFFKAMILGMKRKRLSPDVILDFQAKHLSKKNNKHYDYAIGFLEGWSDRYLAYCTNADFKYAWLHSTFSNITKDPNAQLTWMKRVDKIVFVTDACTRDFKKIMPEMASKAITVENIIDGDLIRNQSFKTDLKDEAFIRFQNEQCFKIITVCRITTKTKGLDRVVSCAKNLYSKGIKFLWYIVGSGEDEQALKAIIEQEGVSESLVLIGARLNPYPFIKKADIMCMPSRYEGKPMVVTESMILGTPPVVTEYLSAHEQIKNGIDGIVVANDDNAIINAVEKCVCDVDFVNSLKAFLDSHDYGNKTYIDEIKDILF